MIDERYPFKIIMIFKINSKFMKRKTFVQIELYLPNNYEKYFSNLSELRRPTTTTYVGITSKGMHIYGTAYFNLGLKSTHRIVVNVFTVPGMKPGIFGLVTHIISHYTTSIAKRFS